MTPTVARLQAVRKRIAEAAGRVSRSPDSIRLVVVTKGVEAGRIRELIDGEVILGESRIQEALSKREALDRLEILKEKIRWHWIGHLQRNKVRQVVGRFDLIHSVDSLSLAREIDRQAGRRQARQPVLLEVNLGGEASKYGFSPEEAAQAFAEAGQMEHLWVRGLMVLPPQVAGPEEARPYFRRLREMGDRLGISELSMGMSADFEVAVEEGATWVRVGTAIFGARI